MKTIKIMGHKFKVTFMSIAALLLTIFILNHLWHTVIKHRIGRACSCNPGSVGPKSAGVPSNSNDRPKYMAPVSSEGAVVVRRSVNLYTAKAA